MIRALTVLGLVASLNAWAVGEHVVVKGIAKAQLSETICISMECAARGDVSVTSAMVKNQLVVKVLGADGTVRLSLKVPLNQQGQVSSTDLMSASSQLIQAIENPKMRAKVEKPVKKHKKLAKKSSKYSGKRVARVGARSNPRG